MVDWENARDKTILASNVTGMVSAVPATYMAVRNRKQGGLPRDVLRTVADKKPDTRLGRTAGRVASALDSPKSAKLRLAAGAAGAGAIGLQGMNIIGDSLNAHKIATQKKTTTDDGITKCYEGPQRTGFGKAITYDVSPSLNPQRNDPSSPVTPALAAGSAVSAGVAANNLRRINRDVGRARNEARVTRVQVAPTARAVRDIPTEIKQKIAVNQRKRYRLSAPVNNKMIRSQVSPSLAYSDRGTPVQSLRREMGDVLRNPSAPPKGPLKESMSSVYELAHGKTGGQQATALHANRLKSAKGAAAAALGLGAAATISHKLSGGKADNR